MRRGASQTSLALLIANLEPQQDHLDEAEKHAKLAVGDIPTEAHRLLAQVWMERKNYDKALEEAKAGAGGGRM